MRKSMVLLLSVMMASAFSGCGSSNSSTSTNVTSTANEHSQSALEDNTVEPEPEKTQELINKMVYRNKSDIDTKGLSIGILYANSKEENANELKFSLEVL